MARVETAQDATFYEDELEQADLAASLDALRSRIESLLAMATPRS